MKLHRAEGLLDVNAIAQRVLVVIGLGSLGSQVLSYLAYPWEQIWLVDPQALSIENIERHVLGISAVGQPKTAGMRDWLIDRGVNPARIKTMATGFAEALVEVPSEALVVASIDDHHARVALSGACGTWDVPLVAGGIYPKGAGADIAVLPHPDVICYGCTGPLTMPPSPDRRDHDYGVDPTEHLRSTGQVAIPALRAPVGAAAALMARAVLDLVANREQSAVLLRQLYEAQELVAFSNASRIAPVYQGFGQAQAQLGMLPNFWTVKNEGGSGGLTGFADGVTITHVLSPWASCPNHSGTVSVADI